MPMLSNPAFGPRTAIIYITLGTLIDVWTAVWYFAFARHESGGISANMQFWLWGFFLTGLTLIVVGLLLGHIGRAARRAECRRKTSLPRKVVSRRQRPRIPIRSLQITPPRTRPRSIRLCNQQLPRRLRRESKSRHERIGPEMIHRCAG